MIMMDFLDFLSFLLPVDSPQPYRGIMGDEVVEHCERCPKELTKPNSNTWHLSVNDPLKSAHPPHPGQINWAIYTLTSEMI